MKQLRGWSERLDGGDLINRLNRFDPCTPDRYTVHVPDWNQLQYNALMNIGFVLAFGALDIARAINRRKD